VSSTTWVHRAARVAIRPLVPTAVTPNHLTTLRLATGLAAAAAFARGDRSWDILGGVLFVVSAFLDRADGELARVSGKTSPLGHRYDLASDAACNVIAFAAIGIGLSKGPLAGAALLMGLVAAVAIGALFWLVQRLESTGESIGGAGGFDPDDALFIVGPAAWFGGLGLLLHAAAVAAPVCLVLFLWRYRKALA
jgi:phosphatidylglycerophosphate synthase